jgi:hypothetical protein
MHLILVYPRGIYQYDGRDLFVKSNANFAARHAATPASVGQSTGYLASRISSKKTAVVPASAAGGEGL